MPTLSFHQFNAKDILLFDWTAVAGATDYEVFQLQGNEMVSIGTTASTNLYIKRFIIRLLNIGLLFVQD